MGSVFFFFKKSCIRVIGGYLFNLCKWHTTRQEIILLHICLEMTCTNVQICISVYFHFIFVLSELGFNKVLNFKGLFQIYCHLWPLLHSKSKAIKTVTNTKACSSVTWKAKMAYIYCKTSFFSCKQLQHFSSQFTPVSLSKLHDYSL